MGAREESASCQRRSSQPDPRFKPLHREPVVMLGSEYPWLFDYDTSQQVPNYLLDVGAYAWTDGGDMSAGFDLSSAAQEPSTTSTTQMNNSQQPLWFNEAALSINQGIDFASVFTDANFSAPNPNFNLTVVRQDARSLPVYQDHILAHKKIDAELFYRNAQSPLVHQYIDQAVVNQGANSYDTSAALSMQHAPHPSLREERERSLLEEAPCIFEFGARLVTESGIEFGTQPRIEFGNADEGPQLDREQPQQYQCHEPIESLEDIRERLNKQDEKIRELELAVQSEPPQTFIDIPRQWVEVQANFEQYFERLTDWAEEHSKATAEDMLQMSERVEALEAEVLALRQCIDNSS